MDLSVLIGTIIAFGTLLWGTMGTGNISQYINVPSLIIVFGGTVGCTMFSVDMGTVKALPHMLKIVLFKHKFEPRQLIEQLVKYAEMARRDGILALDKELKNIDDDFMRKALQLLVDGTAPELIRDILETEIIFLEQRHNAGIKLFNTAGALAPAFGFLGTLVGLIAMLVKMSEPEALGPAMAVALVTTLYGVILSNMVFIPIGEKLKLRNEEEILGREIIIEGVMSIQSGNNPRIVEDKLNTFLAPGLREERSGKRAPGAPGKGKSANAQEKKEPAGKLKKAG